jgi:hypothetical protein
MSEELARRERYLARREFQRWLDAQLTPPSDVPAELVRERWMPIEQFIREGPDVGETDFPESEAGQRIN